MSGIFSLRKFSDIDLKDSFFDSLKADYQGSEKTADLTHSSTIKLVRVERLLYLMMRKGWERLLH